MNRFGRFELVDGKDTLRLFWTYFNEWDDNDSGRRLFRITECAVKRKVGDEWEEVAHGVSRCAPEDQYNRGRGRRIALSRALVNFDKDFRTKMWTCYFSCVKDRRSTKREEDC